MWNWNKTSGKGKGNQGWFSIKKIAAVLILLLLSLWGTWFFVVPESFLVSYLQRTLSRSSIALELTGFKKGLFYTIHAERASLSKRPPEDNQFAASPPGEGKVAAPAFLVVQNLDIKPDILSFLKLTPRFNFSGKIGYGSLRGTTGMERAGVTVKMHGEHINIDSIPILAQAGIYGEGNLTFDFLWRESRGETVFSIDDARLRGVFAGNKAMPLNFFKSIRGLLTLGDAIAVNSLALEGPGVYVRMKGEIREGLLSGRAEIMVDATFAQYSMLAPLLEKYKTSPGYYIIPFSRAALMSADQP